MAKYVKIIEGAQKGTTCFVKQPLENADFYETFQNERLPRTHCIEVDIEEYLEEDSKLSDLYMN
ncbi:MAG: hypothetical protein GY827_06890 [Cytophagales bacterium]|nr:hypothetical protein [Cytophagales bacterium]